MTIVCVDNTPIMLQSLKENAQLAYPYADVQTFLTEAAEVEYHARFITPWAKIRIPLLGRSLYASAVRADMSVGDTEFQGPAPFYRETSKIVKRQAALHPGRE